MQSKIKDSDIIFRKLKQADLPSIISLIEKFGLQTDHISNNTDNFIVVEYGGKIIGCGCFVHYADFVEIRSLAVEDEFQIKGIGSEIIKILLKNIRDKNEKIVYLRTFTHNKDFFIKQGFKEQPQEMVLTLFEQCQTCERYAGPKCAVLLRIDL